MSGMQLRNSTAYVPPESLWQFIKAIADEKELDSIKAKIGTSLIETNCDLHSEIDTLLEIWRDYRNETTTSLNQMSSKYSSSLPEAPNIRDTIKKEINFFVKQMREQHKSEDTFCRQIVNNKHNLNVINYVLNSSTIKSSNPTRYNLKSGSKGNESSQSGVSKRPESQINVHGEETPLLEVAGPNDKQKASGRISRVCYTSMSQCSNRNGGGMERINSAVNSHSPLVESIELAIDEEKINCFDIDEVVDHIRDLLQEECDTLLKDVDFLYECIDQENEYRQNSEKTTIENKEPSLNELKEERRLLESNLMSSHSKNQVKIGRLPEHLESARSNRSIYSPLMSPTLKDRSKVESAQSNRSQTSAKSVNSISNDLKKQEKKEKPKFSKNDTSLSSLRPAKSQTNINNIIKPKAGESNRKSAIQNLELDLRERRDLKATFENKIKPRSDSASSSSSRFSLSSSMSLSKVSSVQKFRKMVMDYRD